MNINYMAATILITFSVLLLVVFVKKNLIRRALVAFFVAQFITWPATLLYVYWGFQTVPFRLFPHATDSNFLYSFIFQPAVFTTYYLYYPRRSRLIIRILYSVSLPGFVYCTHLIVNRYTDLVHLTGKFPYIGSIIYALSSYYLSRKYIDWFFKKSFNNKEAL